MFDLREPKYQWGQRVQALADLVNDGSFPNSEPEAVLVPAGGAGAIVQIGRATEANMPVYLVEFGANRVVGCLEGELAPA